jgi:hypothetical protein
LYDFGGSSIDSSGSVEGLRPAACGRRMPTIRLWLEATTAVPAGTRTFTWPGRYGLTLDAVPVPGGDLVLGTSLHGVVVIAAGGREVRCHPHPLAGAAALQELVVRRVLPRVALLNGAGVLHAAAVVLEDGCALLIGGSGSGKSTLAAFLALAGWSVFADDYAVFRAGPAGFHVFPGSTGVCLRLDTLDPLGIPRARCRRLSAYEDKVRFEPVDPAEAMKPSRLRALVFLEPVASEAPLLGRVPASEALVRAARQLLRLNPSDRIELAGRLGDLAAMVQAVPAFELRRPRAFGDLTTLAMRLREVIAS